MSGRSFNNSNYRYGFNGKEIDKDINEGTMDYGARIYDNRLGRFFSQDPLRRLYPSRSPYSYAGNSPIRFADFDGNGDDDRIIAQRVTGKRQLLIMVVDHYQIEKIKGDKGYFDIMSGEWDYIFTSDLRAARDVVVESYQKKGLNLDKIFLGTHSAGETAEDGNDYYGLGLPVVDPKTENKLKTLVKITDLDLENNDGSDSDENQQIKALQDIFKTFNYDATLISSSCSMGGVGGDNFWNTLVEKTVSNTRLILLTNKSPTNRNIYSHMLWDRGLSQDNYIGGWTAKYYHNSNFFMQKNISKDLFLRRSGGFYFRSFGYKGFKSSTKMTIKVVNKPMF